MAAIRKSLGRAPYALDLSAIPAARLHRMAFTGIFAFAILLRLLAFQGYSDSDPRHYTILANALAQGITHFTEYDGAVIFPLRLGIYAPAAAAIKVLGLTEFSVAIYPLLVSISGLLLAYLLARHFFGPAAGLIGMATLAVLPLDIRMASTLFGDPTAALWANVGIAALLLDPNDDRMNARTATTGVLAGLCFGIAWLAKESVVYLGPFVFVYLMFLRNRRPVLSRFLSLFFVGVGGLLVIGGESTFYGIMTGDWLFHLHALEKNYRNSAHFFFLDRRIDYSGWSLAAATATRILLTGPIKLLTTFGSLTLLAVVGLVWATTRRDKRFLIPGVWFASLVLVFNFGSVSLESYRPLPLMSRYLYNLLLPTVLITSGLLATLLEARPGRSVPAGMKILGGALVVAYLVVCVQERIRLRPDQIARDAAAKLSASDVVFTDYRTSTSLVFFRSGSLSRQTSTTIPYEGLALNDLRSGSYVLVNTRKMRFLATSYGYRPPEFASAPPKEWTEILRGPDGTLFRIE